MIPWTQLDTAKIPGGGEMRLIRRGAEFAIMLGTNPLMNSRLSGSEVALATLSCAKIKGRAAAHVLIGGLGMGFTLRAALPELAADARVTVAELVPEVAAWARGPMAAVHGDSLDDPRVKIHAGVVGALIRGGRAVYDAILLDVDNGPDGLTQAGNDRLYSAAGLAAARAALKPGGVLAVWSCAPDERFAARFGKAGFAVEEVRVKAHAGRSGTRHVVWVGART